MAIASAAAVGDLQLLTVLLQAYTRVMQLVIELSTFYGKYCSKIIEDKLFLNYPPACDSGNQGNLHMVLHADTLLLLGQPTFYFIVKQVAVQKFLCEDIKNCCTITSLAGRVKCSSINLFLNVLYFISFYQ